MLGQYHHGFFVEQALIAGLLQVRRKLAVQACGTLVIGGEQFGLNAEQIATVAGRALIDGELDAQVRQVMSRRPVCRPHGVGGQGGNEGHGEKQIQKFAHENQQQPGTECGA